MHVWFGLNRVWHIDHRPLNAYAVYHPMPLIVKGLDYIAEICYTTSARPNGWPRYPRLGPVARSPAYNASAADRATVILAHRAESDKAMPFSGGPDLSVPQPEERADTPVPFSVTLATAGTAEDFATIPVGKKGHSIDLINLGPGSIWIVPDANATAATGIMVKRNESYSADQLGVASRWSFIGETGKTPAIRGVVWCGA